VTDRKQFESPRSEKQAAAVTRAKQVSRSVPRARLCLLSWPNTLYIKRSRRYMGI